MNYGNHGNNATQEDTYYDPYNPNNVQITKKDVEAILNAYHIKPIVHNMTLYRRAFIHESYVRKNVLANMAKVIGNTVSEDSGEDDDSKGNAIYHANVRKPDVDGNGSGVNSGNSGGNKIPDPPNGALPLASKSNQRLEFLGDGILESVAKFWIYRNFPKASEGFMTDIKINLVKNQAIGRIAQEMGLGKWMIVEKSQETKLRNNEHQMGCLFEAFVGAMFLDMNRIPVNDEEGWFDSGLFITGPGFQMVQLFLERVFERHVDRVKLITENHNFKRILQEKIQSTFKVTPVYVVESQPVRDVNVYSDSQIQNVYKMGVYLCLGQPCFGMGRENSVSAACFSGLDHIDAYVSENGGRAFIYLGEGENRVKKEAEQAACKNALEWWRQWGLL